MCKESNTPRDACGRINFVASDGSPKAVRHENTLYHCGRFHEAPPAKSPGLHGAFVAATFGFFFGLLFSTIQMIESADEREWSARHRMWLHAMAACLFCALVRCRVA